MSQKSYSDDELNVRRTRNRAYEAQKPPKGYGDDWRDLNKPAKLKDESAKQRQRKASTSEMSTDDARKVQAALSQAANLINKDNGDDTDR